jgi:hypothetical protein
MPDKVSGNPKVFEEAHEKHAKGGKVGKKKHHRMHPEGHMAKHRHDRPRRARGGHVGSDKNPMSSAHHGGHAGERKGGAAD